jgi:hypothetical protein
MVFYDISQKKALIRHEDKKYFSNLSDTYEVMCETNMSGRIIGYYIERDVDGVAIDYSEAIKSSPKEFLRLLYQTAYAVATQVSLSR